MDPVAKGVLADGRKITGEMVSKMGARGAREGARVLGDDGWAAGRYDTAAKMFENLSLDDDFVEFLTLPAYELLD